MDNQKAGDALLTDLEQVRRLYKDIKQKEAEALVDRIKKRIECAEETVGTLTEENTRLKEEAQRLREALQYIVDHHWVNGSEVITGGTVRWKWINEFVDVAHAALKGEGR